MPDKRSIAGIAIVDRTVFIAKRLPGGDLGGKWEFPGGKLEPGESEEEALVREYREEFGVTVTVGERLGESGFLHNGATYRLAAYRIVLPATELSLLEHAERRWVGAVELLQQDLADSDRSLLPFVLPLLV